MATVLTKLARRYGEAIGTLPNLTDYLFWRLAKAADRGSSYLSLTRIDMNELKYKWKINHTAEAIRLIVESPKWGLNCKIVRDESQTVIKVKISGWDNVD